VVARCTVSLSCGRISESVGADEFMFGWAYGIFGCVGDGDADFSWWLEDPRFTVDDAGESEKLDMSVRFNAGNMLESS